MRSLSCDGFRSLLLDYTLTVSTTNIISSKAPGRSRERSECDTTVSAVGKAIGSLTALGAVLLLYENVFPVTE